LNNGLKDIILFNKWKIQCYKLEERLKQKKLDEEERKQINLYKKAILELRREEKI